MMIEAAGQAPLTNPKEKIVSLQEASAWAEDLRSEGKTLALANGCFDILHVGHVRYLKGAAETADALLVGVNDDDGYRFLKQREPAMDQNGRALMVAAIDGVDRVVIFSGDRVDEILLTLRPEIHAKGTDYTADTVPEKDIVASYGGEVVIAGDPKDHATTRIIEKLSGADQ